MVNGRGRPMCLPYVSAHVSAPCVCPPAVHIHVGGENDPGPKRFRDAVPALILQDGEVIFVGKDGYQTINLFHNSPCFKSCLSSPESCTELFHHGFKLLKILASFRQGLLNLDRRRVL